ncbi:high choriolytic enzyme 1-like [Nothobranchius furzeri]|uniref:Metalloendopeptidase n=1 Tax=Nothobranchius furzeri TaxID=105023 RepID=A0A9D2Y225_NOTFU|nr:astacin-like metalloprotease toxin 1 [Nothobranchius furzeri]
MQIQPKAASGPNLEPMSVCHSSSLLCTLGQKRTSSLEGLRGSTVKPAFALSRPVPITVITFTLIHKMENVYNFNKKQTNNLGTPYDFTSVMHYGKYDFTWNGQPTIVRRGLPLYDWGKAHQMSANDILRVNRLYRCRV